MRKPFLSGLRYRLTIIYSTLFGFFICIFAFILSNQYLELLRNDFDSALLNFGVDISRSDELTPDYVSDLTIPDYESRKLLPFAIGSTVYILRSSDGKVIGGSLAPPPMEIPYRSELVTSPDYTHRFLSIAHEGIEYRAVNIKMTNKNGVTQILQVATPSGILSEQQDRLILMNLLTIPLLILVSSLVSYLVAGKALDPIRVLTQTAQSLAVENLSQRVPELNTHDEVAELSRTFNKLLERLEKSFRAQENFVANASHQLNTPLSIIKGELAILESKPRSEEEVARFRKSLREELERLIDLVKKLLLISRVEAGHANFIMGPVRVDEVLLHTISRLTSIAREKKMSIRFNISEEHEEDALIIHGDRQLLDAMFENILENAIKYSPSETVVLIEIIQNVSELEVKISDDGPGMSSEEWEKLVSGRYMRGTGIALPGTGIGLSIVKSIAELHKGKLHYHSRHIRGSIFTVIFPQQKTP